MIAVNAMDNLKKIEADWLDRWPEALAIWSKFTKLSEPHWCLTDADESREQLRGSFAMIRLDDQAIVISIKSIEAEKLQGFPLEIMAHEIGHHVYCPGDLTDQGRMIARMRRSLPTKPDRAALIGNLYCDLFINDRLKRSAKLDMPGVYKAIGKGSSNRMWTLYMRIYEILWSIKKGELATGKIDKVLEGDAQLGARLIRSYAHDWLKGAGRFAALCLPYLLEDEGVEVEKLLKGWLDTAHSGHGADVPAGLTDIDSDEIDGAIHPSDDPDLNDGLPTDTIGSPRKVKAPPLGNSAGQHREPFEYGEILKSMGIKLSDQEIASRYYRERALPYLIKFPSKITPESTDPLPEGLEPWNIGSSLEDVDWIESVFASPHIVPGMTTLQRVWGTSPGYEPKRNPLDLDLYVDSSASMLNPQKHISYLTLAGAIVAMSALRAGSRVQTTLWSGHKQFITTKGFVSDEKTILAVLTGFIGGATAFPIHILRDTFKNRTRGARPVHIMVMSDEGVDTMFAKDEKANSGWDIARMALDNATGGGSLVLNLFSDWQKNPVLTKAHIEGWNIHAVKNWADLLIFARRFSELNYGAKTNVKP